tara:strand:+ start:679 stop:1761 length:1083 start_codon:yes stop_codon:yes gene_type:complete
VHATRDSSFADEVPASILPPREPAAASAPSESQEPTAPESDVGLAFRDEAPRLDSDPPQVLDLAELALHEESQRIASDPPQFLDVAELALHEESQRIDSDPPQFLDLAAPEFAEAESEAPPALLAEPPQLQPAPEAPRVATPEAAPPATERGALKLKVSPRVRAGSAPGGVISPAVGTSTEPARDEAIGTPLRPRKLLAPREAGPLPEIDAELIPEEVHADYALRREAQDLSVAERQARTKAATQQSALVIGGVFAIGALLLSPGPSFGAFLVFLLEIGVGAGTGWYLGTKRPNRLVGAVTTWAAALGLAGAHIAVALALYGASSLALLFFPLVLFQALAALSGMFLSTHLESLESDQSI